MERPGKGKQNKSEEEAVDRVEGKIQRFLKIKKLLVVHKEVCSSYLQQKRNVKVGLTKGQAVPKGKKKLNQSTKKKKNVSDDISGRSVVRKTRCKQSKICQKTVVCYCFMRSYRSPGPSSPRRRACQAVASLFPSGSVTTAEAAGHRTLLPPRPRARRLLTAHPATLPPSLATRGAAVLPIPSHPSEEFSHVHFISKVASSF